MESQPATRAKASRAGAPPPCCCLPEEIVIWEILVHLPPRFLIRCRAICRAWRRATSTHDFLLSHHARQPSLPIVSGEAVLDSDYGGTHHEDFLTFDHRAVDAELQRVARLDASFNLESSCDGLLVLSKHDGTITRLSVCNPVTREHAPLVDFSLSSLLAMYMHCPTGEYRLLLHRMTLWGSFAGSVLPKGKIGCYVFTPGSDQPPRYIQGPDAAAGLRCGTPSRVRDSLHWFPHQHQSKSRMVLVFDTTSESFRQIHAPVVLPASDIFEMDDTLGIYNYNIDMHVVDIWMLQNYEAEVWVYKYNVKLPVAEFRAKSGGLNDIFYRSIVSVDGDVLLLLSHGGWMFYVNTDGKLVESFHRDGQRVYATNLQLKQTLVPHNFFTSLEDSYGKASPFL